MYRTPPLATVAFILSAGVALAAANGTTSPSSPTQNGPQATDQYASEAQAKEHCGAGGVVWVNTRSHVYHLPGTASYGHTKHGAFMCQANAVKSGSFRAAKGEKQTAPQAH